MWVAVAEATQITESVGHAVQVKGRDLALFRVGETLYCIDNSCPHRDAPLAEGYVQGETVTCPWHSWQINLRTGRVFPFDELCVRTYACKVEGERVYVELE